MKQPSVPPAYLESADLNHNFLHHSCSGQGICTLHHHPLVWSKWPRHDAHTRGWVSLWDGPLRNCCGHGRLLFHVYLPSTILGGSRIVTDTGQGLKAGSHAAQAQGSGKISICCKTGHGQAHHLAWRCAQELQTGQRVVGTLSQNGVLCLWISEPARTWSLWVLDSWIFGHRDCQFQ